MACEKPFKEGYLLVPQYLKKKWQKKFVKLFASSTRGLQRIEIFENEDETKSASKTISLVDCIKISAEPQKNHPFAFTIVTKNGTYQFATSFSDESQLWVLSCQTIAFEDTISRTTIEEDNELYCPSGDAGVFRVALVKSDASQRCHLAPGEYTLVVAPEELQLRHPDTQNLIFTWPYRFIRRYGIKNRRFTFEAGRKCASGEGSFDLEHSNPQDIFQCTTAKMESMKQKLCGNSSNNSIESDDALAAAMSMSARSRSPLAMTSCSTVALFTPSVSKPPQNIPVKPPRKINQQLPVPPRYDVVEVRTEAWRTFGTEFNHTERPYGPSGVFQAPNHSDYDKLDHFGAASKPEADSTYQMIYRQDSTGYGAIRKKNLNHEIHNDLEYAVVCKPHRV